MNFHPSFLPMILFVTLIGFFFSVGIFKNRYQPPERFNFANGYKKIRRWGIIPFAFFIRLIIPSSVRNISNIYLITRLGLLSRKDFLLVPPTIFVGRALSLLIIVWVAKMFFILGMIVFIGLMIGLLFAISIGGKVWRLQYSGNSYEDRGIWEFLISLFFWGQLMCLWSVGIPQFPWLSEYQYFILIFLLIFLRTFSSSLIIHIIFLTILVQMQIISHINTCLVFILLLYWGDYLYLQYKHKDYLITLGCLPFLVCFSILSFLWSLQLKTNLNEIKASFLWICLLHFALAILAWSCTFFWKHLLYIKKFTWFSPNLQMLSLQETEYIRNSINPPNLAEIEIFIFRQELGNVAWLTHDFLRLFLGYVDTRTGSYSIQEVQQKGAEIENQLTLLISDLSVCLENMAMRFLSRPIAFMLVRLDSCLRDFEKIKSTSTKLLSRLQSFHSFHGALHKNAYRQIEDYTSKILDFSKYNLDYLYLDIDYIDFDLALELENELDEIRESLYEETQQILSKPNSQVRPEFLFVNLVKHLEHIGDFLLNICQTLKNFQQWYIPIDKESMQRIQSCRRKRGGEVGISSGS